MNTVNDDAVLMAMNECSHTTFDFQKTNANSSVRQNNPIMAKNVSMQYLLVI